MRRPTEDNACTHADVDVHCEPTWNVTPYGWSPRCRAWSSSALAWWASAPNFRDKGKTLPESSTRTRTYTADPGAQRAILSSSPSESMANRHTPASYAARTCVAGLTVLL